jgi:hypothetical protein
MLSLHADPWSYQLAEIIHFEKFKKLADLVKSNKEGPLWDSRMSDLPTDEPDDNSDF